MLLSLVSDYRMLKVYDHHDITVLIAAKPECAEIYAIKNEYGSVEGGDEVWIRGSKMIGNRMLFDVVS